MSYVKSIYNIRVIRMHVQLQSFNVKYYLVSTTNQNIKSEILISCVRIPTSDKCYIKMSIVSRRFPSEDGCEYCI